MEKRALIFMSADGFHIADSISWGLAVVNINTCTYCLLVASSRVRRLLDVSDFPLIGMLFSQAGASSPSRTPSRFAVSQAGGALKSIDSIGAVPSDFSHLHQWCLAVARLVWTVARCP